MRGKLLLEWPRFLKDFLDILCISVGAIQGNKKFPSKNVLCYSIVQLTSNLEILVAYHTTVWINVPCYTMVLAKTQFYVLVTEFRFLVSWFFFSLLRLLLLLLLFHSFTQLIFDSFTSAFLLPGHLLIICTLVTELPFSSILVLFTYSSYISPYSSMLLCKT